MTALLRLYDITLRLGTPALRMLLNSRLKKGKEDPVRFQERMGETTRKRPHGFLVWVHAASVGEAQSALILIDALGKQYKTINVLVTTGTVTSAALMQSRLPAFAFHQFAPVDHPDWVDNFMQHWTPDFAIWMESELWPNMLVALKEREIPSVLVNARLSDKSFQGWSRFPKTAKALLETFDSVLAQTDEHAKRFLGLGAKHVVTTDNIKYSAAQLPCNPMAISTLRLSTHNRRLWVFASTHAGEEDMACRIHKNLKTDIPNLLTVIVPRHPARRDEIYDICMNEGVAFTMRSIKTSLPKPEDDVYVADTLGELGLFYTLCPIAVIGRSFSHDGGGGHNPIEAAQLGCVVLTGPNNQFQRPLYDDMAKDGAVIEAKDEADLTNHLRKLMTDDAAYQTMKSKTSQFVTRKTHIVDDVMKHIIQYIERLEKTNAA